MGQSVEHSSQGLLGVQLLWFEQLLQELLIEHGSDDVIHDWHITGHRGYSLAMRTHTRIWDGGSSGGLDNHVDVWK